MLPAISSLSSSSRFRSTRSSPLQAALALAVAATGPAAGCTLTRTTVTDCRTNAECRGAFGFGSVCGDDGLCAPGAPTKRCTQTDPPDLFEKGPDDGDRILFGNLMDRSVETHVARERSAQLAYDQANGEGGLGGREFGAVFCTIEENSEFDDLTRVEAAKQSAEFLSRTIGVPAIVGPAASSDTQEVFQDLKADGVVVISPSATSPALTALDPNDVSDDSPGLLWRTAPSDALQGSVIASDMLGPGEGRLGQVTSVAAIHEVGAYGEGLFKVFADEFRAGGGSVEEFPFEGEGQLTDAIADVGALPVQEVLFISSQAPNIVAFLNGAATLPDYDDKNIFLTDAAANPDVLAASSTRFDQVRATRPAPLNENDDPVYASFIAAYTAAFREDVRPFSFAAHAYDAAWLLVYGAAWAVLQAEGGVVDGGNIARGLRHVSSGATVEVRPSGWVSVLQAFREGKSINASGASGAIDYDPTTEETSAAIQVWRIEGRNIDGIYTVNP